MDDPKPNLAAWLPPSLGSMFGQRGEVRAMPCKPVPPSDIPGAFAAPELCTLVEDYRPDLLAADSCAEVKLDGLRCLHIGAGRLVTREGSPFEAASHCVPLLRRAEAIFGAPMFFDGEYIEEGGLEATTAAFRARVGKGCLWLFDAVPLSEWASGQPSRAPLIERKLRLRGALLEASRHVSNAEVGYIEHVPVTASAIETQARDLWSQGYEGLVVKNWSSRYVRRRTCDWMKVKLRTVSDMVVIDVLGCTRDGRETAQSLVVRLLDPKARAVRLPLHGGLADTLWRERVNIVGEKVKVEHAGFTAGGTPREAVLKQVTILSDD